MDNDTAAKEKDRIEKDLLDLGRNAGADWFTKLATVERAKALRRESQKAREGQADYALQAWRLAASGIVS